MTTITDLIVVASCLFSFLYWRICIRGEKGPRDFLFTAPTAHVATVNTIADMNTKFGGTSLKESLLTQEQEDLGRLSQGVDTHCNDCA